MKLCMPHWDALKQAIDWTSRKREKDAHTCIHFTGIQHKTCKVNVPYEKARDESVKPYKFACLDSDTDICPLREYPTPEQIEADIAAFEKRMDDIRVAVPACREDAKANGFGKGRGGRGAINCPVCKTGKLHYSVAGYNGHMWGKCTTEGCMSWMQ
jgi:hypothetical protein